MYEEPLSVHITMRVTARNAEKLRDLLEAVQVRNPEVNRQMLLRELLGFTNTGMVTERDRVSLR